MSYQKLSIKEAINYIDAGRMFLPEIQRKFVWKETQIENLFDSLILGYPIGALLFWRTSKMNINSSEDSLNLYRFIKEYHERDNHDNQKESLPLTTDYESYYIVLDGQQRLSSLYIAIKGSVAYKLPRCWWNVDSSFPKKELYMNVNSSLTTKVQDDDDTKRFKFLTQKEYDEEPSKWFKVKDIFRHDNEYDLFEFVANNYPDNKQLAGKNIMALYKVLTAKDTSPLSFYEIEEADYDDVLNIFVRVNSSGTPLSKTDLLFSTLVSSWTGGREEIESLVNTMNGKGDKFSFDTDFIMRAALTLTDSPINLKIESFKKANVLKIADNWEKIKKALLEMVEFLTKSGFSDESITSYNALIPIAYYLYRGGQLSKENIAAFKYYFIVAQLKSVFSVASNTVITETRRCVQKINNFKKEPFSISLFNDVKLTGGMNFEVTEDLIDRCFDYDKGSYTFMILSLLYPEVKLDAAVFHQDHVHPYAGFDNKRMKKAGFDKDTAEKWQMVRNKLANLQLLQGPENESKNDSTLVEWIAAGNSVKYMPESVSYELKDFEKFYDGRKALMKNELCKIFNVTNSGTNE